MSKVTIMLRTPEQSSVFMGALWDKLKEIESEYNGKVPKHDAQYNAIKQVCEEIFAYNDIGLRYEDAPVLIEGLSELIY